MVGLRDVIESDLLPVVERVAPLLGSLLGSPLAGAAVALIAQKFNIDPSNLEEVRNLLTANPDAETKLKEIESDNKVALLHMAELPYVDSLLDKKDARSYGYLYRNFLRHMAYLVTVGFFGTVFLMCLPLNISSAEKNILSMLVGMLASKWQTIIDFYYGSPTPTDKERLQ